MYRHSHGIFHWIGLSLDVSLRKDQKSEVLQHLVVKSGQYLANQHVSVNYPQLPRDYFSLTLGKWLLLIQKEFLKR